MFKDLELVSIELSEKTENVRGEVREFLEIELAAGTFTPQCDTWLRGGMNGLAVNLVSEVGWV